MNISANVEDNNEIEDAEIIIGSDWIENIDLLLYGADAESGCRVAIIDAMGVVQSIKKTPQMKKMSDFRDVFIKKIQRRANGYTETRVVFDEYFDNSLKENTRAKRASDGKEKKKMVPNINYRINENMTLASVSLKSLNFY